MLEFLFIVAILYLIIAPSARYRYRQGGEQSELLFHEPPSSSLEPPSFSISDIDEIERYANEGR